VKDGVMRKYGQSKGERLVYSFSAPSLNLNLESHSKCS